MARRSASRGGFDSHALPPPQALVLVAALAFLAALAGCGSAGGQTFVVDHERPDSPLPVQVIDRTGMLVSVVAADQTAGRVRTGITPADGLLPTVEVWWVGHACDERVSMKLDRVDHRFRLEAEVVPAATCIGVPVSRAIQLTFVQPVSVDAFEVIVPPWAGGRPQD